MSGTGASNSLCCMFGYDSRAVIASIRGRILERMLWALSGRACIEVMMKVSVLNHCPR